MDTEKIMPVAEAVRRLGIRRSAVYAAIKRGHFHPVDVYGDNWLSIDEVEAYREHSYPDGVKLTGRPRKISKRAYGQNVREVVDNAEKYHDRFYEARKFTGPSLHFHLRALQTRYGDDLDQHLEHIYAALPAWGMHHMGPGGPKMLTLETFRDSVVGLRGDFTSLRGKSLLDLAEADWDRLRSVFMEIKVMSGSSILVGHSKVLAHMIPDIVSPIDRRYTLRFLNGNINVSSDKDDQWRMFRHIHEDFVKPIACDPLFRQIASAWIVDKRFAWDTSIPKVIDNLVIGQSGAANESASAAEDDNL
jgi:hypothetical protein